jgi:N-acetylmuramoyl-L-alanine amidase
VTAFLVAWLLAGAGAVVPGFLTVSSSRGEWQVPIRAERGWPAVAPVELGRVLSVEVTRHARGAAEVLAGGRRFDFVLDAVYFRFGDHIFTLASAPYLARDTLFVPLQWAVEYLPRLVAGRFRYDTARATLVELPAVRGAIARGGSTDAALGAAAPRAAPAPAAFRDAPRRRHVVALDPGHGGPDVGMVGPLGRRPFLYEKDVTLAMARGVAEELARRGIGVVLTRTRDTLIALEDRGRIARANGADLFVSIHVNAANRQWRDAAGARGFETYFLSEAKTEDARRVAAMENESMRFEPGHGATRDDPMQFILNDLRQNEHLRESSKLAAVVERELGRVHPSEERGVKQAGFAVLATAYMPAVLIEIGFGSNYDEAKYLTGSSGQRRLARGIAQGIASYLAAYDRRLAPSTAGEPQ